MQADVKRQLGLDWLRIGAFALLILYHIGMFFGPWGWHINAADPVQWLQWPMMAVNPWRLALLFVISGVASRALLVKLKSPATFGRSRSLRLLVPLLFGMAVLVAPQPWIELRDRGSYHAGFLHFWFRDYFEFGGSRGTPLPTWNHLWFVAYLWAYSVLLALLALVPDGARRAGQTLVERALSGWRLLVLPILLIGAARLLLLPTFGETHALIDDPYAHVFYGFCFFIGVALGRSGPMWRPADEHWRALLTAALVAALVRIGLQVGSAPGTLTILKAGAFAVVSWTAVVGLLGWARAKLNFDAPARRYITEAIFPFYIVHQTLIILAGYWTKQVGLHGLPAVLIVLGSTAAGCLLTFELARRVPLLRPLLGLKSRPARPPTSASPLTTTQT